MKFSIKDFFSKCNQIRSFLRIWSHLLKKSLMENFIFYAVRLLLSEICARQIYEVFAIKLAETIVYVLRNPTFSETDKSQACRIKGP